MMQMVIKLSSKRYLIIILKITPNNMTGEIKDKIGKGNSTKKEISNIHVPRRTQVSIPREGASGSSSN